MVNDPLPSAAMPETIESFRERGNDCYKKKEYLEAIEFYNRSVAEIDAVDTISSLLLNCATITMKINTSMASARVAVEFAAAALTISPSYEKAQARLFNELRRLGEKEKVKYDHKLHTDIDILLAVSDAVEGCIDEILVRHGEISEMKSDVSVTVDDNDNPSDLKAKGNALATKGRPLDALMMYLLAIQNTPRSKGIAMLLSNRAICYQQLLQHTEALQNAIGAICCDPLLVKAHFHRASALAGMGQSQRAMDAVTFGLQLDPKNFALLQLSSRLTIEVAADGLAKKGEAIGVSDSFIRDRMKKAPELPSEATPKSFKRGEKERGMNARQVQAHNKIYEDIGAMTRKFPLIGQLGLELLNKDVPSFHVEFSTAEIWPAQCDVPICEDRLHMAYESGRGAASFYNYYALQRKYESNHLLRRMNAGGANAESIASWFARAKVGEINLNLRNKSLYDPRVLHSFANAPNRVETLTAGRTTVSMGFVDLGLLREAKLDFSGWASKHLPTKWVGYEATAYCVAKTAVIIGMLHQNAAADCVLQVWYSAAWSSNTLVAFRRAVTLVLEGGTKLTGASHPDVRVLLQTWQSAKVSLARARSLWLESTPDEIKWRDIGSFKRAADRKALCAYSISGQLLEATMGSVVMFELPLGYMGGIGADQRVFECITFKDLIDRCLAGASDIVTATIDHLRGGITKLIEWVQKGKVVMDVRLCAVDPDDKASVASVAALDPHTITWSNVCDYYPPKDFHDMARACSGRNTVHHAYR